MKEIAKTTKTELANKEQWTSREFIARYTLAAQNNDTMAMARMERKVTMETALNATPMKQVMKAEGMSEDILVTVLAGMILRLAAYFNLGNNLNQEQAIDTAYILMEKYPYETIEDFTMVFKNAKMGMYGKLFNRLDGQIIFEWMEQHMEAKSREREDRHRKTKDQGIKTESELMEENRALAELRLRVMKKALGMDPDKKSDPFEKEKEYQEFKQNYIDNKLQK